MMQACSQTSSRDMTPMMQTEPLVETGIWIIQQESFEFVKCN